MPRTLAARFGFDVREREFWAESLAVLGRHIDDYELPRGRGAGLVSSRLSSFARTRATGASSSRSLVVSTLVGAVGARRRRAAVVEGRADGGRRGVRPLVLRVVPDHDVLLRGGYAGHPQLGEPADRALERQRSGPPS